MAVVNKDDFLSREFRIICIAVVINDPSKTSVPLLSLGVLQNVTKGVIFLINKILCNMIHFEILNEIVGAHHSI